MSPGMRELRTTMYGAPGVGILMERVVQLMFVIGIYLVQVGTVPATLGETRKEGERRSWPPCVTSCAGLADGDYQSCQGCNMYASCVGGQFYDKRPCPAQTVWDDNDKRCNWASTTCQKPARPETSDKQEVTQSPHTGPCPESFTGFFPHIDNCARFYNCSDGQVVAPPNGSDTFRTDTDQFTDDRHLECPYPLLFSLDARKCMPYQIVRCGNRFEPKSPCDYQRPLELPGEHSTFDMSRLTMTEEEGPSEEPRRQRRTPSHGPPCHIRYPVCIGMSDGPNVWAGKLNTPYFAICKDERTVDARLCEKDEFDRRKHFWSRERRCESVWYIPRDEMGERPECEEKEDGFYTNDEIPPHLYYQCRHGLFNEMHECPLGQTFNANVTYCE